MSAGSGTNSSRRTRTPLGGGLGPTGRERQPSLSKPLPDYAAHQERRDSRAAARSGLAGPRTSVRRRAADDGMGTASNEQLAERPWQSPAVMRLMNRAMQPRRGDGTHHAVAPMIVEGPKGTVIRAVGEDRDHIVAGNAVARVQEERSRRQARAGPGAPEMLLPPPTPSLSRQAPPAMSGLSMGRPSSARKRAETDDYVFGAVYEHTDSFGKPKMLGTTSDRPEVAFRRDVTEHRGVARLLGGGGGSSRVVWAGVGRRIAGLGEAEIATVTQSVAADRSARLRVTQLSGIKPYSRHGY